MAERAARSETDRAAMINRKHAIVNAISALHSVPGAYNLL
jgi:hypothetical protein